MPVSDYNKVKKLDVDSVSGTPTVDKAQPITILGENYTESLTNSETGTDTSQNFTYTVDIIGKAFISEIRARFQDSGGGNASGGSITISVEDSDGTLLASRSFIGQSSATASFNDTGYNRIPNDETVTVRIEWTQNELETDTSSFDGKKAFFNSKTINAGGSNEALIFENGATEGTTGNGPITLDWSNVSDAQDIAVYDQNGNLLDYEIESLDTTAETGVLWAYDSWVRDGSTQAQVAYGDNSSNVDRQNVTGTWNNTDQNAEAVYHLDESSGVMIDSTANNNDSTSTTGTTNNVDAELDGGRGFDGTDDEIRVPDDASLDGHTDATIAFWMNADSFTNSQNPGIYAKFPDGNAYRAFIRDDGSITFQFNTTFVSQNSSKNTGESYHNGAVFTGGTDIQLYQDGSPDGSTTTSDTSLADTTGDLVLGQRNSEFYDGWLDAWRLYSDAKDDAWIRADYDASPKAGQVFFSQQAAEATVTDQTVSIPETQLTSSNPAPEVNAFSTVNVSETTATTVNPAPTVTPGTATVNVQETTATTSNPAFTVQPGNTTVQTPVSTATVSNPDPTVNAFNTVNVPETTVTESQPNPTLTVGQTILTPETTVSASNPDITLQPGETSLNIPQTQLTSSNPDFGLNRQIVVGVATKLESKNPDPEVQPGAVSVTVQETSVSSSNPALQVQPGETKLETESPTKLETVNPDFNTVSGPAELQVSETQLTASIEDPSIGLTLQFRSPTNALIINDERYFDMPDHTFTEGDLGDTLQAVLKDDSNTDGVSLTGATQVKLVVKDRDGVKVLDKEMSVTDSSNGRVEYKWDQGDFIEDPGVYRSKIKVFDSSNEPESFPNDGFRTIEIEEEIK